MSTCATATVRWMAKYVTVEPLLACYYIATTISNIVVQNLTLYKSCWPDAPPPTMTEVCPDEAAAQALVASIASWKTYVLNLLPVAAILVAGPWSDRSAPSLSDDHTIITWWMYQSIFCGGGLPEGEECSSV